MFSILNIYSVTYLQPLLTVIKVLLTVNYKYTHDKSLSHEYIHV